MKVEVFELNRHEIMLAQEAVMRGHYLHAPVDARCSVEGYMFGVDAEDGNLGIGIMGYFLLGRPEATVVNGWYGSVDDQRAGNCEVTRWQVLNLARVYIFSDFQPGGYFHDPMDVPGFVDRKGTFRSTLASSAISAMAARVGFDYLMRRPPCFLDEPYQIEWLLSYCDTRLHKGTIYRQSGFELYRTNGDGIQTWRLRLPALSAYQDGQVREASLRCKRSQEYRARRAQMSLELE
jgi:hypothetical protein